MQLDCPVYVIDDDPDICRSLKLMLSVDHITARTWPAADAFMADLDTLPSGIVVSDVCMPGMDGLALLEALRARGRADPMIVVTGEADVPLAVRALKSGAVDFIEKPFEADRLISALDQARERLGGGGSAMIVERLASLSKREREVLECLVDGATNKRIAYELGISPRTVEIYRAKLMEKMQANSLSRLVRMGVEAGIGTAIA